MSRQRIPAEDLPKLPVQQLSQIKEQLDSELQVLNDSLENIRTAATKYEAAGETLRGLSSQASGKPLLVPLTGSLYVSGSLGALDKVLVDVGTNYYVKKSASQAEEYCERKIAYLKQNHEKVAEVASQKAAQVEQVGVVLQNKLQEALAPRP